MIGTCIHAMAWSSARTFVRAIITVSSMRASTGPFFCIDAPHSYTSRAKLKYGKDSSEALPSAIPQSSEETKRLGFF